MRSMATLRTKLPIPWLPVMMLARTATVWTPWIVTMAVLTADADGTETLGFSGSRSEYAMLMMAMSSEPSHPLVVQKSALVAAMSAVLHAFARMRQSAMAAYRQRMEVGL